MRIRALAKRLLAQLLHDPRTIALVIIMPIAVMTIVYYILGDNSSVLKIGITQAPAGFTAILDDNEDIKAEGMTIDASQGEAMLKSGELDAVAAIQNDYTGATIEVEGSDVSTAKKAESAIRAAVAQGRRDIISVQAEDAKNSMNELSDKLALIMPGASAPTIQLDTAEPVFTTNYLYGNPDATAFETYGSALIGIVVFFLVYLLSGINFLAERLSGTLEKLLSTPIRRWEIVLGYVLGFSVLAVVQTVVLTLYLVYVLNVTVVGSIWLVLLVNLLTAMTALTLGMLLSTLANSEFQFMQFIPIILLPQVFLCGLFPLTGGWKIASAFMPITYTTTALKDVMIRGFGFSSIAGTCGILAAFSIAFMLLNNLLLKRQRSI